MKLNLLILGASLALSLPLHGLSVKVVKSKPTDKGVTYRYAISNSLSDIITVHLGESCQLFHLLESTFESIEKGMTPLVEQKGDWLPNMAPVPGTSFYVETDDRLGLGYIVVMPSRKLPVIEAKGSRDFELYVKNGNDGMMLNLPICINTGSKKASLVASEDEWENADRVFNLSQAYQECIADHPPGRNVDPTVGDIKHQCTDNKYEFIANTRKIQFGCVLEKRLKHRLSHVALHKQMVLLQTEADRKTKIAHDIEKDITREQERRSSLKLRQAHLLEKIGKTCKD